MVGDTTAGFKGTIEERDIGPCPLYVVTPDRVADSDRRVFLDIHGGAWVLGGGDLCKRTTIASASAIGVSAWSVDYRMPPDHPFPTPLDDCLTAYRVLLDERHPSEIIVGGTSAGGNLAAALILRARDEGLPLPAAVVFNTGAFDLTGSGDSWQTNDGLDNVLSGSVEPCTELYAGVHDRRSPTSHRCSVISPGFRPSSSSPAHATGSSRTTCVCTGLCGQPESRPSCTCGRQPVMEDSLAWHRRMPSASRSCGASPRHTGLAPVGDAGRSHGPYGQRPAGSIRFVEPP